MPDFKSFFNETKNSARLNQRGAALLYFLAAILVAGALGAAIVSLTTTATFSGLQYNHSEQAKLLAQSGLDYAGSALEADDPILRNQFRSGIDETVFNMDNGRFILTVSEIDSTNNSATYRILSEGRVQVGAPGESGFQVTGEYTVSGGGGTPTAINFEKHNIRTTVFYPGVGYISLEEQEETGYTYVGYSQNELKLYDAQGSELVTITANNYLRYSVIWHSIGTRYEWGQGGLIDQGDHLEFTFPGSPSCTELTINFSNFGPQDEAEVQLATSTNPNVRTIDEITNADLTGSELTINSAPQSFDRFTVTNTGGGSSLFGIIGIGVE